MNYSFVHSLALSLLPCLIPPYAFRLSRIFGTRRVGWVLFAVFTLLAALQLLRSWQPQHMWLSPRLTLDLLNFLIPMLLLIGMVHIETFFKERLRLEEAEKKLRANLELQVQERTAELDQANDDLQHEIALRMQGEAELLKSKEQYRFLFEENPQPMWIFDLNSFQFLAFNRATLRHYGFTGEEFRALTAKDLYPAEDLEAFLVDCAKTKLEVQRRETWRHCKKDGTLIDVELTTQDMIYTGCPARLMLANDVTAQRLLQKQLLQAQKMEVTTQMAGGVADNFNKLINVIEGDATELIEKFQDHGAVDPLKRIAANAGSAAALTRQLLALVRRHPMRPQPLDLNKLIENQTRTLDRLLGDRITLETNCGPTLPSIMADTVLVEQILRNLVLNARDAMPQGGSITLGTTAVRVDEEHARRNGERRPGTYACLTVSDTGSGMSAEVQGHLFEPFFTTKGAGKAAGLGLATVHGLVKQHSGWVEVSTQAGAGSRFAVFFPCATS